MVSGFFAEGRNEEKKAKLSLLLVGDKHTAAGRQHPRTPELDAQAHGPLQDNTALKIRYIKC